MLLGSSHGGFIGAHLSMTVPELCCVALRNPVVAVDEMYGVTDIPDWTIVETGGVLEGQWDYLAVTEEQRAAMRAASPLHRLAALPATTQVAPTLLGIGGGDCRVPPAQGKRWYYALRGRNVDVTALRYEKEEHGLQSQPETRLHWITSVVDYFRRHHADSPAP